MTLKRSAALRATFPALYAEARALIARSRELCLPYRRIRGANDAEAPPPAVAVSKDVALWRFLEGHRGRMFCTQCIARALAVSKRIDRAVLGAEGRGARRQYGTCSSCGKERLLCGLAS